jgi:hypothetical protein
VVVFNYSNCIKHKNFFKKLYEKKFKRVIFYSDIPDSRDKEVNYLSIHRGFFTPRIFSHLRENYKDLIDDSDGIFYTMDDNIINLNMLDQISNSQIIYEYAQERNRQLSDLSGWWWDTEFGKTSIKKLEEDIEFQKYNIIGYTGAFSDYFYLPKRYLTDDLFDLFKLFSKHNVFLEISVPTVINYIEPNSDMYNKIDLIFLWGNERNALLNKSSFYEILNRSYLLIHPIKVDLCPESKNWLTDIFNL